jgi:hypothetical protein
VCPASFCIAQPVECRDEAGTLGLAGQRVGVKEVDDGIWIVSFMRYDLGYIDLEARTLQPLDNPIGPRLSPNVCCHLCLRCSVTHVPGLDTLLLERAKGFEPSTLTLAT